MKIADKFSAVSRRAAEIAGSWQAFIAACTVVITWTIGGFYFGFLNEIYQLFINSLTTIITFLMVFLIQSAQNRDTKSLHIKINDLLCSIQKANESLIDIESGTDEQISRAKQQVGAKSDLPAQSTAQPYQNPE